MKIADQNGFRRTRLSNHGKTEDSDGLLFGRVDNSSSSQRVGWGVEDMVWDVLGVMRVDFIGCVGSGGGDVDRSVDWRRYWMQSYS